MIKTYTPITPFSRSILALSLSIYFNHSMAAGAPTLTLDDIVVSTNKQDMTGIADTASEGTVSAKQLKARPLLRPAEVMETIPGMIVTQHSGDGKANQYFLRGFNLDHGSDFATSVNGMPINNVTHAHGQGYMDLNFLIPELVSSLRYRKGMYAAEDGDLAVTGSTRIDYARTLTAPFIDVTVGEHGYRRGLAAGSEKFGEINLLGAVELVGNDGPWEQPEGFVKRNVVLRASSGTANDGYAITAMAYEANWSATEQVPERAIQSGEIGRYGTLSPTDGGKTHRYSLTGEWGKTEGDTSVLANAYVVDYGLDLISSLGSFDSQLEQVDERVTWGGGGSRSSVYHWAGKETIATIGAQFRQDRISKSGLFDTENRVRVNTTREDKITESALGIYAEAKTQWQPWLRSSVGGRWDTIRAKDTPIAGTFNADNGGSVNDHQVSPKLGVVLGPFGSTEYYANWGHGFHSNDARGSISRTNASDGTAANSVPLIAKATGSEIGVRTQPLPGWFSSLVYWQVKLDSELVYVADEGVNEARGGSERHGVEWSNFYNNGNGWILDADLAVSQAHFTEASNGGKHVPNAVPITASLAATFDNGGAWFGGVRARYLGASPLEESGTHKSSAFWTTNLKVGYRYDKTIQFTADVLNLFNSQANDIEYWGASCTVAEGTGCGGGAGIDGRLVHPLEPRMLRLGMRVTF